MMSLTAVFGFSSTVNTMFLSLTAVILFSLADLFDVWFLVLSFFKTVSANRCFYAQCLSNGSAS